MRGPAIRGVPFPEGEAEQAGGFLPLSGHFSLSANEGHLEVPGCLLQGEEQAVPGTAPAPASPARASHERSFTLTATHSSAQVCVHMHTHNALLTRRSARRHSLAGPAGGPLSQLQGPV